MQGKNSDLSYLMANHLDAQEFKMLQKQLKDKQKAVKQAYII